MAKVIWIVNEYNPPGVPRTRQTILAQHLEERGYKVYLICGSIIHKTGKNMLSRREKLKKIKFDGAKYIVVRTSTYRRSYERALVSLQFQNNIWVLRKRMPKPDVIVSEFAGWFGNVFLKWKRKYGTKIIYDILDPWPEDFVDMGYIKKDSLIAKYLYNLEHKSYREADGVIFSFQGGKQYIIDKGWSKDTGGDVDTSDIGYLNNGVDLETLDRQKEKYILDDSDLDTDKFKVIYLGSISEFNGVDKIVEVANILNNCNQDDVVILVYGYGNQEDSLKKKVKDYGLSNIIFKGKLDKKYAMNVLSRGDLNIFTFRDIPALKYGVSPNKLFMYFASGKPVLSMIQPGYDIVEEKKPGISIKNDPQIAADTIIKFKNMDTIEYESYCINAGKIAEEYDYSNLVNVLIHHIEK